MKKLIQNYTLLVFLFISTPCGFFVSSFLYSLAIHRLWGITQYGTVNTGDCDSWYANRMTLMQAGYKVTTDLWDDPLVASLVGRGDLVLKSVIEGSLSTGTIPILFIITIGSFILGVVIASLLVRRWRIAYNRPTWGVTLTCAWSWPITVSCVFIFFVNGMAAWHLSSHPEGEKSALLCVDLTPFAMIMSGIVITFIAIIAHYGALWTAAINGRLIPGADRLCAGCSYPLNTRSNHTTFRCSECGMDNGQSVLLPVSLGRGLIAMYLAIVILPFACLLAPKELIGRTAWAWIRLRSTQYWQIESFIHIPCGVPVQLKFGDEECMVMAVMVRPASDSGPLRFDDQPRLFVQRGEHYQLLDLFVNPLSSITLTNGSVTIQHGFGPPPTRLGQSIGLRLSQTPTLFQRSDQQPDLYEKAKACWLSCDRYIQQVGMQFVLPLQGLRPISFPWE